MQTYYGLVNQEKGWAVMSEYLDDPNPPILVFESQELAQKYQGAMKLDLSWKVAEIDVKELENFSDQAGDRLMLVISVEDDRIGKLQMSYESLMSRQSEREPKSN